MDSGSHLEIVFLPDCSFQELDFRLVEHQLAQLCPLHGLPERYAVGRAHQPLCPHHPGQKAIPNALGNGTRGPAKRPTVERICLPGVEGQFDRSCLGSATAQHSSYMLHK